jgi:hypothetical protein
MPDYRLGFAFCSLIIVLLSRSDCLTAVRFSHHHFQTRAERKNSFISDWHLCSFRSARCRRVDANRQGARFGQHRWPFRLRRAPPPLRCAVLTGLSYLKTGNLTSSALQREVSGVHASAVYSRHVHIAAIFHSHFILCLRTAPRNPKPRPDSATLREHDGPVRSLSPVIKHNSSGI